MPVILVKISVSRTPRQTALSSTALGRPLAVILIELDAAVRAGSMRPASRRAVASSTAGRVPAMLTDTAIPWSWARSMMGRSSRSRAWSNAAD